jgi:glyoxylase-like metal-dependent hydrolase (beta-lactamase superfamily II)
MPKRAGRILAALHEIRRRPSDVRAIVLTHHHVDHTGSVRALASATGAPVLLHGADASIVRGAAPPPRANRATLSGRILGPAIDRLQPRVDPPARLTEIDDGESLPFAGGIRVVHTPGHTPGHVSLLIESRRVLIAGDAAGGLLGRVGPPFGMYTEDVTSAGRSIAKLAALDFDAACFGHGRPVRAGANAAFRRLAERLAAED